MAEKGYTKVNKKIKQPGNVIQYDIIDANGNVVGRVDQNYRVDGKVTPVHCHFKSEGGNIHWYCTD